MVALTDMQLYLIAGGAGLFVITIAVVCLWRKFRRRGYTPFDASKQDVDTSPAESKVKAVFERRYSTRHFKSGYDPRQADRLREEDQKRKQLAEKYATSMVYAANFCRSCKHRRRVLDILPRIGSRPNKFYFIVTDEKIDAQTAGTKPNPETDDFPVVMHLMGLKSAIKKQQAAQQSAAESDAPAMFSIKSKKDCKALRKLILAIQHPLVVTPFDIGVPHDRRGLFVLRKFSPPGSLRDRIFRAHDLSQKRGDKYHANNGKALAIGDVARYGRHVLEAMMFFKSVGFPFVNLHAGNVFIDEQNCATVAEWENALLAQPVSRKLHKKLSTVLKTHPEWDPAILAFGYLLHEMASGGECSEAYPPVIRGNNSAAVQQIVDDIFQRDGVTTWDALLAYPFFQSGRVGHVPKSGHERFGLIQLVDPSNTTRVATILEATRNWCSTRFGHHQSSQASPSPASSSAQKEEKRRRKREKKMRRKANKSKKPQLGSSVPNSSGSRRSTGFSESDDLAAQSYSARSSSSILSRAMSSDLSSDNLTSDDDSDRGFSSDGSVDSLFFGSSYRKKSAFTNRGGFSNFADDQGSSSFYSSASQGSSQLLLKAAAASDIGSDSNDESDHETPAHDSSSQVVVDVHDDQEPQFGADME